MTKITTKKKPSGYHLISDKLTQSRINAMQRGEGERSFIKNKPAEVNHTTRTIISDSAHPISPLDIPWKYWAVLCYPKTTYYILNPHLATR